jgi:hypothetical protein
MNDSNTSSDFHYSGQVDQKQRKGKEVRNDIDKYLRVPKMCNSSSDEGNSIDGSQYMSQHNKTTEPFVLTLSSNIVVG